MKEVKIELRGDDIEMLDKALSFIPVENEDVISYLSSLKSSINEESVDSDDDDFKLEDDLIDDDFNEDDENDEDVESDDETDDETD